MPRGKTVKKDEVVKKEAKKEIKDELVSINQFAKNEKGDDVVPNSPRFA